MTDNDWLLKQLREAAGGWVSQDELIRRSQNERGHGLTVHSRIADLRKQGHTITNMLRARGDRRQSFYRLAA